MKIKILERTDLAGAARSDKAKVSRTPIDKTALKINLLYLFAIVSISAWIISLKALPFGDTFQFLLGAVVLSVNLLIFKHTKI